MAKYEFLRGEFYNISGVEYECLIYKEDSSDPGSTTIPMNGMQLQENPLGEEGIQNRIWSSKMTANFIIQSQGVLDDFLSILQDQQEETYFMEVNKNGSVYWQGVVIQDLASYPSKYVGNNYTLQLTASDGISELMSRPIDSNWVADYVPFNAWGDVNFVTLLRGALDQFDFAGTTNGRFR